MAWRIRLRGNEGCEDQPFITPDLVIKFERDRALVDFALAEQSETRNIGGLRSREALVTAMIIQIFSDARAFDEDELPDDLDPDRRGWWGDSVARVPEQGRYNIGSRLWTLRRSRLTADTARLANDIIHEALQPIVDQGAVASFEIATATNYVTLGSTGKTGVLEIDIKAYGQDGTKVYDTKYSVLWDQVAEMRGTHRAWAA
jgi:phage gp46-like protein